MVAKRLTSRQADVLGVVDGQGPVTAHDVGEYHLPIGASSARSALAALEHKGLVGVQYTGLKPGQRGRAYVITHAGSEALAQALEDAEEDLAEHMRWRDRRAGR